MFVKIILLLPIMASCEFVFKPAQVYEPEIITSSNQFTDLHTEASNMQNVPMHFDFKAYQKIRQLDPQRYRYLQQQIRDQFHANGQYHANYRDTRNDDQQLQASNESAVKIQTPVGDNWKMMHENVQDYVIVTSLPITMMEDQNTSPTKQQNLLEKEEDLMKAGSYGKITPTLVPTEDSGRKGRVYKKSLQSNSYHLDGDTEIQPTQPLQERQDINTYVEYLNPHLNQQGKQHQNHDQLSALTSLLGKHPAVQLQGLNQLLRHQGPVYKKDNNLDHENQRDVERNNNQRHNQNYPTLNNNALQNAIIAQTKAIQQSRSASPSSFNNLQAQLDATAQLHANKIIAQAQQKALEHVHAQHKAIAFAHAQAEQMAIAQVQAQNDALERAHAKAEQERANVDENKQKDAARLQRLVEERKRFQEQIRQKALQRKLREQEESEQQEAVKQTKPLPVPSELRLDAGTIAEKTRQKTQMKISPAESQDQYYHHVPSSTASVEIPSKLQVIHSYSPRTIMLNALKTPAKFTSTKLQSIKTPTESFVDIHAAGYNQHTKSEDADVTKYFVPPQGTANEYKNANGEHDMLYAAKYAFGYRIRDYHNGNDFGHEESKDGEQTKGHYHVLLPDGRVQNVHYIADDDGFHAKVSYGNEIAQSSAELDDVSK